MPISKKDIEVFHFDKFRSAMPAFPNGSIEVTEEPDFLVRGQNFVLGIELTELHRETPLGVPSQQAREAMRHRVVARAQEIYAATCNDPVRVTVIMDDSVHIHKSMVEQVANSLSAIVVRNIRAPNSSYEESYSWTNRSYFPEILRTVSVHRLEGITSNSFSVVGATWVAALSQEDIERVLQLKEAKYPTYRQRCDSTWLVINTDLGPMSTWFEFESQTLFNSYRTSFDRVFVMRHFGNTLFELKVKR